ncbi:MAG: hypothetical protein HHJ15_18070 [Rhodoferax sp.]|uniref:hypothetical protein n=1 Tax=Rhodoferax sp. TaxID=50421 RepID=UPI00185A048E|nr:hypothetical protein [Rhodoferax sp.]NMM21829.1 hypothetical protein [Rhodoferax sp.]
MTDTMTTEERCTTAIHASNLRVEADRTGSADVIIAMGMSRSRLGAPLLRLRSEWDGAGLLQPGQVTPHEFALLLGRLKTLPSVRYELGLQAARWGISADVVAAVLLWWLMPVCQVCHGRKYELEHGATSHRHCKHCKGTGQETLPHGEAGRKIEDHMTYCMGAFRDSVKKLSKNIHN